MAICPKCGMRIEGSIGMNRNFCQNCGCNLTDVPEQYARRYSESEDIANYNLITAFVSMFKKYAQFNGRSRRSEYWYATLANVLISMAMYIVIIVMAVMSESSYTMSTTLTMILGFISLAWVGYAFAVLIPSMAICVRRLHDTGRSGWNYLYCLIPYIGSIILIVFLAQEGQRGPNIYGPDPKMYN